MDTAEADRIRRNSWDGLERCYDACRRAVFEPRARELVGRADLAQGARVLDLGTGTGIAAFEAIRRVGPRGHVVGSDTSPGLLAAAQREARERGVRNLGFVQTSMTALAIPDDVFDGVVANFSLCCSHDYEATLREARRVLRAGGTLTYNHDGPLLNPIDAAYKEILEQHRLSDPPTHLRRLREATALIDEGWSEYKDPATALAALQTAGFREATATLSLERREHRTPEEYLDYKLTGSVEVEALSPDRRVELRNALREALRPHLKEDGLVLEQQVLTLQGTK